MLARYAASVFGDVLNCAVADDMPLDQMCVSKLTESLKGQEVPQFVRPRVLAGRGARRRRRRRRLRALLC